MFNKIVRVGIVTILSVSFSMAQNYKGSRINALGKVTDGRGKFLGSVNAAGEIMDTAGVKLASIDEAGILVDAKTGKKLGKAEKNGYFIPFFKSINDKATWTASTPAMGIFYVKGLDGKILAKVHEKYKMSGAGAIYCLQYHMKQYEVLDKSKITAKYSCPMHPEITSDKAGKCGKCGMGLNKN